jgi:hypothetical protein
VVNFCPILTLLSLGSAFETPTSIPYLSPQNLWLNVDDLSHEKWKPFPRTRSLRVLHRSPSNPLKLNASVTEIASIAGIFVREKYPARLAWCQMSIDEHMIENTISINWSLE